MNDKNQPPVPDPNRLKSVKAGDVALKTGSSNLPSSEEVTLDESSAASSSSPTDAQAKPPTSPQVSGLVAGRYEILQLLGEGGMGTVYKARDRELERTVALKTIRQELGRNPVLIQRFKQELILARQVTHRNVVRIYDLGEAGGVKFITMEYVDGEPLTDILQRRGKLSPKEAADILEQVSLALQAAHAEGVVHRDLKPGNIMQDRQGRVVVMDFGLAHSVQLSGPERPLESGDARSVPETMYRSMPGSLTGTPRYMSPEQARREEVDARSDLYSLGLILYELLTGEAPFAADNPTETLLKRTQENPPTLLEVDPHIPRALSNIAAKCLQLHRESRYQTIAQLLEDLQRWRKPTRRAWTWAAAGTAVILITGVQFFIQQKRMSGVQHAPVSVLVADFKNETAEPLFDGTLEPALGVALEGASFITGYNRAQALKIAAQLQAGATKLDEPLARLVATRENVHVIVTGLISSKNNAYDIELKAIDPSNGKSLVSVGDRASKQDVLLAVGRLAARIRKALGDVTPESLQLAAAETFTSGSLEAAHEYAVAQELQWAGKRDQAIEHYSKAVQLDPELGRAYSGLAVMYANSGELQEADKYYKLALSKIDRMSDREKYRTRGGYYLFSRNPNKALEEFTQLVQRYPSDTAGIANEALAYFYLRDMTRALQEGRRAVAMSPKNVLQRNNVALYAMYAGDFAHAIREFQTVLEMNPSYFRAYVGLALSQLAEGQLTEATETYQRLEKLGSRGASFAFKGSADVALYQGRAMDAIGILQQGVAHDLQNAYPDSAAQKLVTLGEAYLLVGRNERAVAGADKALATSKQDGVKFMAAQVYLKAGRPQKALAIASQLGGSIQSDPQAYAKLIQGELELQRGKARDAFLLFQEANKLADTWMGRFDLGRAYVAAGAFAEADSELETCLKRRGEATALFLDEVPTYNLFPPVYYYLGRAQEGLKSPAASDSYKRFLSFKDKDDHDPLVADTRRRLDRPNGERGR